ncbi:MAG: ABC transporter ATP-binding protein [Planctomycetes bacterium]|nr:ABC transporter ATP-binding protein [Planctomycetota bacterium]MCW8136944.1 ABC transporter ATP-binding protein [Planctomycetota bacterium]
MVRNFLKMVGYAGPYKRLYITGIAALLLVDVLDTFTPKLVQWAINHLYLWRFEQGYITDPAEAAQYTPEYIEKLRSPVSDLLGSSLLAGDSYLAGIWVFAVGYVMVVALTGVFRYWMSLDYAKASIQLTHDLRCKFYAHVQRLPMKFHDRAKTGEMMSLATADMDAVRMFYGFGLLLILDTAFYFVMVPLYMTSISWKLMLASMVTLPLIPLIVAKLAHAIEDRYEHTQEQFAVLAERTRESYAGAKVVKSFVQEDSEVRAYAKLCREYFRRGMRLAKVVALENPLLVLMLGLADLVVVVYGGYLVIQGEVTVGGFFAFFQYLIRLSGPMIGLGWVVMLYQRGRVSMNRIQRILAIDPEIKDSDSPAPLDRLAGGIEIKGLNFQYFPHAEASAAREDEDAEPIDDTPPPVVLSDINLSVKPGQTVAIVGPVGSGKSTLLNMIPRLYDPPAGTVYLDGHDVRNIRLDVLRTQIGVVPQETFLFSEPIIDNIALGTLGRQEAGNAEHGTPNAEQIEWLKTCARIAQVEQDILEFPNQYQTLLGEKGVNLSGGQKQRVAIARAIARKPAILLLDDCLSAVDTQTEEAIVQGLKEVMTQCTTIIVSHRCSTVEHADEIVVLERGRVAERGTHTELLGKGGYYADLHRKQQLESELAKE